MQSLERTFRIIHKALMPVSVRVRSGTDRREQSERLTVSPFENPYRSFGRGSRPDVDKRPTEDELARAAYFATFPAVE